MVSSSARVTVNDRTPAPSPRRESRRRATTPRLEVAQLGCEGITTMEPHALPVTYWFQPPRSGEPHTVNFRLTGRRIGVKGRPAPRDQFDVIETVTDVVPGSGPVAVTTRIRDAAPGTWHVRAVPLHNGRTGNVAVRTGHAATTGATMFAPVAAVLAPGARLGAWTAFVAAGAVVAFGVQAIAAQRAGLPMTRVAVLALLAAVIGLAGAKLYYVAGHVVKGDVARGFGHLTGGMCIQGFVIAAVATLAAGAAMSNIPVGVLLDVTAPALMAGMAVGRFGCLLGGCCAGRATASRWGVWSSDRRLGMRRIPVQILESGLAAAIATAAGLLVWTTPSRPAGSLFVAAVAAYTLGRQLLFPLRAACRHTAYGRVVALAVSGLAFATAVVVAAI